MAGNYSHPEPPSRREAEGKSLFRGRRENSMDWRREQPAERRGRRLSNETAVQSTDQPASHTEFPTGPRAMIRRASSPAPGQENAEPHTGVQSNQALRRQSVGASSLPARPSVQGSLPSRTTTTTTATTASDKQSQQRTDLRTDAVMPAKSSSTSDVHENVTPSGLVKDIATAVGGRDNLKKEYEFMMFKMTELKQQLEKSTRILPNGNPYIDKLKEDITAMEASIKLKKVELEKTKGKEQSALDNVAAQLKVPDSISAELQMLKASFNEERDRSRKLEATNSALSEEITQLTSLVKRLQKDITHLRDKDVVDVRDQVRQQKIGMARLNDVFASQEALQTLSTHVDKLSASLTTAAPSTAVEEIELAQKGFITQTDLDQYVAVFNQFETSTKSRLQNLESYQSVSSVEPGKYVERVDLNKHTENVLNSQVIQDEKISKIESNINKISETVEASEENHDKMEQNLNAATERISALEKGHEHLRGNRDLGTLSNDVESMKTQLRTQERAVLANTHAVNSLNQRFNNLTTEQLARQMLGVLEPMLTTVKPQLAHISAQHVEIQKTVKSFEEKAESQAGKILTLEKKSESLSADSEQKFQDLQNDVQAVQAELTGIQSLQSEMEKNLNRNLEEKWTEFEKTTTDHIAHAVEKERKTTDTAIQQTEETYQTNYNGLLLQVKEARDGIDSRLTVVETRLSNQQDAAITGEVRKNVHNEASFSSSTPATQRSTAHKTNPFIMDSTANGVDAKVQQTSKTQPSKMNRAISRSSPDELQFARYFQSESDTDSAGDTIDATPKPTSGISKTTNKERLVYIPDSDQDNDSSRKTTDEDMVSDSGAESIDLSKWQKRNSPNLVRASSRAAKVNTAIRLANSARSSESSPKPSQTKRKRELSNASGSKTRRDRGSSGASTPHSSQPSQQGRKKTKV